MEALLIAIMCLVVILGGFIAEVIILKKRIKNTLKWSDTFEKWIAQISQYIFRNSGRYSIDKILHKMKLVDKEATDRNRYLENAVYNIEDLEGTNRPTINFSAMLRDIKKYREKSIKLDNIKPEYNNLVQFKKDTNFSDNDLEKFIANTFRGTKFNINNWVRILLSDLYKRYKDEVKVNSKIESQKLLEITKILRKDPKIDIKIRQGKAIKDIVTDILKQLIQNDTDFRDYVDQINITMGKKDKEIKEKKLKINKLGKRVHTKDQIIYAIRKKYNILAPKKRKIRQKIKKK